MTASSADPFSTADIPITAFPNGAALTTYGGVHMSPDGTVIGSLGTPDSNWQAGKAGASYWATNLPMDVNIDVWTWTLNRL